jgi:putative peptidoglycan lipid II flippase
MKPLKHSGLAFANSLASMVNFTLLFIFLRKKLKRADSKKILSSLLKTALASCIMGVAGWSLLHGGLWRIHGDTLIKFFYLSGTIVTCGVIYFFLSYLMKSEEFYYVMSMVKQKFRR